MINKTLTIILAGGKGTRLEPLTLERAKPAVPFGGSYRIIDFPMSNCINSGLFRVLVLTQYKSLSLDRHLERAWMPLFQRELGAFLELIPPQQRVSEDWYRGTADAVYQNIYSIQSIQPDDVLVLAGDHVYAMDYREMLAFHREQDADLTVGTYRVPIAEAARQFGVIQVDNTHRVVGFEEKPEHPRHIPNDDQHALASMGIYVFKTQFLMNALMADAASATSGHDFGHNILPQTFPTSRVFAFPFCSAGSGNTDYWRDVGTLDAYFRANQDLLSVSPPLALDNDDWPIRTFKPNLPPPVFLTDSSDIRNLNLENSMVGSGSKIVGACISGSVLGHRCIVEANSSVVDSILMGNVRLGRDVRLRRVIVDKDAELASGTSIGFDPDQDLARGFTISPQGITVVPRGYRLC